MHGLKKPLETRCRIMGLLKLFDKIKITPMVGVDKYRTPLGQISGQVLILFKYCQLKWPNNLNIV